jgi:hypothetical protein
MVFTTKAEIFSMTVLDFPKIKHMQTFSGTPFPSVHISFDRACNGDQEYHHLSIPSPSFPYKNCKIRREGRKPEKMGASGKSFTSPSRNIREPRGFDIQIQNRNLHRSMPISTHPDRRMGPQQSPKPEFVRLQKCTLQGFHSSRRTS